ncbi:MAG: sialidase family protein [Bryobacteraceae bacterium]
MSIRRRELVLGAAAAMRAAGQPSIEQMIFWNNLDGSLPMTWFHPRICVVPGPTPRLLMTLQGVTGSDYYHAVMWSESRDMGRSWSEPVAISDMGRHPGPDGLEEGFCDTVPEHHALTGCVIAMAHNVYYKDGKLARPNEQRWPVYAVRSPDGRWGRVRKLEWSDPDATAMYTSNCSQRVTLSDGDVLVPLSHGPLGRADRGVTVVRCGFDGETLRVKSKGNTLRCSVGRGLLEPSLAIFGGVYYMTIRAENGQGFVTRSRDGLAWEPMVPWTFDDGEPIAMSTTQQRWMPHRDGLCLVYTRRDATNVNVMRWRAPLWMAEVDPKRLRLQRASERVVIPLNADGVKHPEAVEHQGNFHTTAIGPDESLVSTGTVVPRTWRGAIRIARVRWRQA